MDIRLKRAYDPPAKNDGYRVLVDRLWPRGVKKEGAELDAWPKDIAPSDALRKEFHGQPEKWDAFKEKYEKELDQNRDAVNELLAKARKGRVTLVYASKDEDHNNAVALKEYLLDRA